MEERARAEWRESFREEDERWERRHQIRDWVVLTAMITISITYHLVIFFLEPGIRDAG